MANSNVGTTDPPGMTYVVMEAYPTTRAGFTFGWEALASTAPGNVCAINTSPISVVNRTTSLDVRLAGLHYIVNANQCSQFRIDVPTAGTYSVRVALGDPSNAFGGCLAVFDGTTLRSTIATNLMVPAGSAADATGTVYTDANWPSSNSPISVVVSGTIMRFRLGSSTCSLISTLQHISLVKQ